MGSVFKKPKPPKVPQPPPMPSPDIADQAAEAEMKRLRRHKGYESTVLLGGTLTPYKGKKTVLG